MTVFEIFCWGACGSIAGEVVKAVRHLDAGKHCLPRMYLNREFYILHLLLALVAGTIAVAYQVQSPLLAMNIGAVAPFIVDGFKRRHPENGE